MDFVKNEKNKNKLEEKARKFEINEIKKRYQTSKLIKFKGEIREVADVIWQEKKTSEGKLIGYILVANNKKINEVEYIFSYSKIGVHTVEKKGFKKIIPFTDIKKIYVTKGKLFTPFLIKLSENTKKTIMRADDEISDESKFLTDDYFLAKPSKYKLSLDNETKKSLKIYYNEIKKIMSEVEKTNRESTIEDKNKYNIIINFLEDKDNKDNKDVIKSYDENDEREEK